MNNPEHEPKAAETHLGETASDRWGKSGMLAKPGFVGLRSHEILDRYENQASLEAEPVEVLVDGSHESVERNAKADLDSAYEISILVAVHGVAEYIERCARSLLNQHGVKAGSYEIIFVNDATRDDSVEILERVFEDYEDRKEHIHIVHNEQNLGLFHTRRVGVHAAKGRYIFFVDGDDWVEPDAIYHLSKIVTEKPVDVVVLDYYFDHPENTVRRDVLHDSSREECQIELFRGRISMTVWSRLFRRSVLVDLYKRLNVPIGHSMAEDWLIAVPIYAGAYSILYRRQAFYHYNQTNPTAMTRTRTSETMAQEIFVMRHLYANYNEVLSPRVRKHFKSALANSILRLWRLHNLREYIDLEEEFDFSLFDLWDDEKSNEFFRREASFYYLRSRGLWDLWRTEFKRELGR